MGLKYITNISIFSKCVDEVTAMNLDVVFQPGGKPLNAFYASVLYRRSTCQRLVCGIIQIVIGGLYLITETAVLITRVWGHEIGSGFWCGPAVIISGAMAVRAHLSQTSKSKLKSYVSTVLSICPFSVVSILIGALGVGPEPSSSEILI